VRIDEDPNLPVAGRIDKAAKAIAFDAGLPAVTLRRVVAQTGLEPAVVAQQEPSMPALAARMFRDIAADELAAARAHVNTLTTARAALQYLTDDLFAGEHTREDWIWADGWSVGRRNPVVAKVARESTTLWVEFVAGIITVGVTNGEFRTRDPHLVAELFVALIDSLSIYSLVGHSTPTRRAAMVEAFIRAALDPTCNIPATSPDE
jgi:AcrR family transcriptional regulator